MSSRRRSASTPDQFNEFFKAFTSSPSTKMALRERKSSVLNPSYYLRQTMQQKIEKIVHVSFPAHVNALIAIQQDDGKFELSRKFKKALMGIVPDSPNGIIEWKWATALAMVLFTRAGPSYYDHIEVYYRKAAIHIDPTIIAVARTLMPPIPCPYQVTSA